MAEEDQPQLPKLRIMETCPIDFGECKKKEEIEKEFNSSQVFLDIPYSGYKKEYEEAIRKAIESFGLTPILAEIRRKAEGLLCNVCKTIQKSGYAVADISGYNPNVLFELGTLSAIGKKYCVLCHSDTKIPVDLSGLIINKYRNEKDIGGNISKWTIDNVGDIAIKISKRKKIIEGILFQLENKDVDNILPNIGEIKNLGIMNIPTEDYNHFINKLIDALKDENPRIRWLMVEALGEIGDARAIESLIITLKDVDSNVQINTIKAMGKIGDTRAIQPLVDIIAEDEDLRKIACDAIIKISDPKAIELLTVLKNDNPSVTYNVGRAIKEIKSSQKAKKPA